MRLQPFSFLDDIGRVCSSQEGALAGNKFLSSLMEEKLLNFNTNKSVCIVIGEDESSLKIRRNLTDNPLPLGRNLMKTVSQYTYLGVVLHEGGAGASALATINKRSSRVKQLIFEIKAILEDSRLDSIGGISSGLDLWHLIVVPYLYGSLECFPDIPIEGMKKLNDLHILFYRCLLNCPRTSPIGGMFWFLGQTLPNNIIIQRTLLLYHHIANLPRGSLALEVINEQRRLGLEGLTSQGRVFLAELGVRETLLTCTSKAQFRQIIRTKIRDKNAREILQMCKGYRKLNYFDLKEETFGLDENCKNMTLNESRVLYAMKNGMTRGAMLNYASDPEFKKRSWLCVCGEMSSNLHFRYCKNYEYLRIGKDFSSDIHLVKYLQAINKVRDEKEKNII